MSADAPTGTAPSGAARVIAAFRGAVTCRQERGAIQWCIAGRDRDSGVTLEVLLSGAAGLALPPELADAEVRERAPADGGGWELRVAGRAWPLAVRALQVHRRPGARFDAALPRVATPWTVRAGWVLLLNALRVPGMARLLGRLRGQ